MMNTNQQQIPEWIQEILKDNDIAEEDIIAEAELYKDLSDEEFKEFEEDAKTIRKRHYDTINTINMSSVDQELDLEWNFNIPNAILWAFDRLIEAYRDKDIYKIAGAQLLLDTIRERYLELYYQQHSDPTLYYD